MNDIIILDTEFWADAGSKDRNWLGLSDFPPLVTQIAAARVSLANNEVNVVEWFTTFVRPTDEFGNELPVTEYFQNLTGITEDQVLGLGLPIRESVAKLSLFCSYRNIFSYGDDIQRCITQACYTAGVPVPFQAYRSFDIRRILHRAGLNEDFLLKNNSGNLCNALGLPVDIEHHDAQQDVISQVEVIKHLHKEGTLKLDWLLNPGNPREHLAIQPKTVGRGVYVMHGSFNHFVFVDVEGCMWVVPASNDGWSSRWTYKLDAAITLLDHQIKAKTLLGIPLDA